MNRTHIDILMQSLIQDDNSKFIDKFNKINLVLDESYLDYDFLKAAVCEEHKAAALFLVNSGCRVNNSNKTNFEETPLHLATKLTDLSVASAILEKDASMYVKNGTGDTPLHAAFKESHYSATDAILDYLSNCNLSFNPGNKDDVLHFHIACIRKHVNCVKRYLTFGFNVEDHLSVDLKEHSGLTPLLYLISTDDYGDLFEVLLNHSDLSIKNENGLTPLHSIYYKFDFESDDNDDIDDDDDDDDVINFYKIMNQVFKHGNDSKFINAVDHSGVSHFHLYCATDLPDLVKKCINNGADVNSPISSNCSINASCTPLHFAIKYGCFEVIKLLLENGADCNRSVKKGATPLHIACKNVADEESLKIIEILLHYSASPVAVDTLGNTPIHLMFNEMFHTIEEEVNVFDKLLSKVPLKVDNLTNQNGLSLLHIFCSKNDPDRINDFLNSGAIIDSVAEHTPMLYDCTALQVAVSFNQKDIVELLLKRGAQVNIKGLHPPETPLHLACDVTRLKLYEVEMEYNKLVTNRKPISLDWIPNRRKQIEIIKLLLLHGAEVNVSDNLHTSPFFSAFSIDSDVIRYESEFQNMVINEISIRLIEITKILILNKENIRRCTDKHQQSIFHIISISPLPEVSDELVELLIKEGVDLNGVDENGHTPLYTAARSNKKELVKTFLKHNANVNIKCKSDGQSLLHYVVSCSDSDTFLLEILLNHGADINTENSFGKSPACALVINDGEVHNLPVASIIYIHIQKLLALGFYVNDKLERFCVCLRQYCKTIRSETNYNRIFDQCIKELNRMKKIKINNYTSLYHIAVKTPHELSKHLTNETLIEILEQENIEEQFPVYSYLLKLQYKKALLRSDAMKDAKRSLIYVIGSTLPDLCYDAILSFLTNEQIFNLKAAANTSAKRKLSENSSHEIETSIKLKKVK